MQEMLNCEILEILAAATAGILPHVQTGCRNKAGRVSTPVDHFFSLGQTRHILRDRRPSTAACWAMGGKGIEIVYGEKKNILYWTD